MSHHVRSFVPSISSFISLFFNLEFRVVFHVGALDTGIIHESPSNDTLSLYDFIRFSFFFSSISLVPYLRYPKSHQHTNPFFLNFPLSLSHYCFLPFLGLAGIHDHKHCCSFHDCCSEANWIKGQAYDIDTLFRLYDAWALLFLLHSACHFHF